MKTCDNCGREFNNPRGWTCPYCRYKGNPKCANAAHMANGLADIRHYGTLPKPRACPRCGTATTIPCERCGWEGEYRQP